RELPHRWCATDSHSIPIAVRNAGRPDHRPHLAIGERPHLGVGELHELSSLIQKGLHRNNDGAEGQWIHCPNPTTWHYQSVDTWFLVRSPPGATVVSDRSV